MYNNKPHYLFYSDKCRFSLNYLNRLRKIPNVDMIFNYISIEKENKIPPNIKIVPTIILDKQYMLEAKDAWSWLKEQETALLSSRVSRPREQIERSDYEKYKEREKSYQSTKKEDYVNSDGDPIPMKYEHGIDTLNSSMDAASMFNKKSTIGNSNFLGGGTLLDASNGTDNVDVNKFNESDLSMDQLEAKRARDLDKILI